VSVIKVKPNGLFYMDFFYTAWANVTQIKLQRQTFVLIQNISLVDYILCFEICKKVKVKQSRYRPGVAQRVPGS